MRRYIALLLTAFLVLLTLVACGNQTVNSTSDTQSSTAPETRPQSETSSAHAASKTSDGAKALVAFFSRTGENYGVGVIEKGNTEIIAEIIASETGADTFRIQTVNAYPERYDACTEVAQQEKDANARPELTDTVENFDDYDVIYLGYPIWWGDMPMAVYTFLESYDFSGKTIIPFCTHGGSGLSDTVSSIQTACSSATVLDGFAIAGTTAQNDPEEARDQAHAWLNAD